MLAGQLVAMGPANAAFTSDALRSVGTVQITAPVDRSAGDGALAYKMILQAETSRVIGS